MPRRDIIVIGASAGGVEALIQTVRSFPADFTGAIFVVLHIPADAPSVLPDILQRNSLLRVVHPNSGDPIKPGTIYVAPPSHHLIVELGTVTLVQGPKENDNRPAVDPLFRSAAAAYGNRVIGVILSGNLDDGVAGLTAIKEAGGCAVVQDPGDALYDGMPRSAIENVAVDSILPIAKLGAALVCMAAETVPAYTGDDPLYDKEIRIVKRELVDQQPPQSGEVSGFTCPECHGALWEVHDGEIIRFRCRIGHAYSPDTLWADGGKQIEMALWTALRTLEEQAALARRLSERAQQRGASYMREHFDQQERAIEARVQLLRRVLAEGGEEQRTEKSTDDNGSAPTRMTAQDDSTA